VFQDSVASASYKNNPLFRIPTADNIATINYDRVLELAKMLYANAADFNFVFVGNYDEAQLRQYIEQYIASLPSKGKATAKMSEMRTFAKGDVKCSFKKEMQNPQAQVNEIWRSNPQKYTLENIVLLEAANRLLDMTFNREIREKLSAAYHAGADMELETDGPETYFIITGNGKLNPEKAAEAIPQFQKGMQATIANPNAEDLVKVKQIMLKSADTDAKTNSRWLNVLESYNRFGVDIETGLKAAIEAVTPQAISNFLSKTMLSSGNHVEVIMMP
jgi:zinc protease